MTSRLIVNSIRHTGASTDSISLSSDGNTTFNATGSMVLPSGTTAQRPGSPSEGMYRYNTTIKANELYNGNAWVTIGQETVDVHYLVIGGGGSGGGDWRGGGGGAGAGGQAAQIANRGSGGGGSHSGSQAGGAGSSGVVIIRLLSSVTATFSSGVTQTSATVGSDKVYTITATSSSSETVTFS